jgi:myo-inositol 2-dehydrogenase/D-chiro-inositol 1-dehydrogenase/scyllo-inositol 2-dehydrogenase (NAD+)
VNHLPGAEVAAVVDASAEARQAAAARFGIEHGFASLADAISGASFDAVVITTPTFTHRALVLEAAAAGKHILCEKPMALTLQECDEMAAAARKAGVVLQLGFMRRFDPEFEAASARIEAGEIGRPMLIKSLTHGPGLPPAWAHDLPASNGMLAEVNSHDWDTVRWLAYSNPVRVYAEVVNFKGAARGVATPEFYDCALAQVRFESGAIAAISGVCPCEYGYDARVEIVGERGFLQIGTLQGQSVIVCTNRDQGLVSPVFRTWPERFASAYVGEMRHFLECIRNGRQPRVTGEDGRWAVAGVLAATKSFRERRPVELSEIMAAPAEKRA